MTDICKLSRRAFVAAGGSLLVFPQLLAGQDNAVEATPLASWLEIRSDNSILLRSGRTETGTGMSAFYAQTLAEELSVRPEQITLLMGDTDRTPDGGYSAGFLTGAANVRKVGAYTFQALLRLAASELGVAVSVLRVEDGIVSGEGKRISYGQLIEGRQLDLKIPVRGNPTKIDRASNWGVGGLNGYVVVGDPPLKPISQYKVIGTSYPMPGIPDKVTGRTHWSGDLPIPGLQSTPLHARMIRPASIGSTLVSLGTLDKKRFPTAELLHQANLVAIVSPDEWEAITAAQAIASTTKWTDWTGLPESENLTQSLRQHNWGVPNGTRGNAAAVQRALSESTRVLAASFEQPYVRHAPIGPYVAVADVRPDGSITVWTHSSHSQGLRAQLAHMQQVPLEKVVVRWLDHAGHYGRTTHAGDGAEADAVLLSQMTGKPVRVQWTLEEDLAWSSVSPGWIADMQASLGPKGDLTALRTSFYSPHMFDARMLGAILAGRPTSTSKTENWLAVEWPYEKIQTRLEQVFGMPNVGAATATGGLRGNIMRTPGHRQQNFVLESLMNEAAALAQVDPIAFRRQHTTEPRLLELLEATAQKAGWVARPSPRQEAKTCSAAVLSGRGVSIIVRDNAYWVGIAELNLTLATGLVQVTRFTIGVDCGKVINPRQLDRCMKGGVVMGLSEALKEEVTFDQQRVTSTDWSRYKILTMAETPEIRVVQISRNDKGFGAGGEAANAVASPAVAAAFFDATGVFPRRLPLHPKNVLALLASCR
ncbi:molybdopterin cofactor-binding domain-containing protein [Bryobacter aggregatus]|uniref:molybdopterin cofactor-binding domain-containing protein n=1 Tax=Bryobacter aggregatus TaxID=360054 RepID=UPI000690DB20|nr:molybdopterin cofactor-binding domain-containing protein [Bryobacter aggregatus]